MNAYLRIILFFSISLQQAVAQDSLNFDYRRFVDQIPERDVDSFILEVDNGNFYPENLFTAIPKIDVGDLSIDDNGDQYLSYLRKYVLDYANDPDSLYALAFYLKTRYNLKNTVYDQMLRQCLAMDKEFDRAMFMLAKIRYENNPGFYNHHSYFLISRLNKKYSSNRVVNNLNKSFKRNFGKAPKLNSSEFEEFLNMDIHYIIE